MCIYIYLHFQKETLISHSYLIYDSAHIQVDLLSVDRFDIRYPLSFALYLLFALVAYTVYLIRSYSDFY